MSIFEPLWKSYIFPALGLIVNTAIIVTTGFPAIIWTIAATVCMVVGCVWIYTDWESGGSESIWPMAIATALPVLINILAHAG